MKELTPLFEMDKIIKILGKISIFGGLNEAQLYKIFRILQKITYKDKEFIFKQDEAPTHIYIILEGKIRLIKDINYNSYQLFEFAEGSCIGEESIIGIQPHTLSAIAIGDVELAVIPKKFFLDFYNTDKDLFCLLILNIAREISRRLKQTDNLLLHYINTKDKISVG
ncbi:MULTISPECIES: cyclic nucleotide-binding domain-containing protein [Psychrilyobacter]|uniref:Cyclic nucleotide-binding domain-containing protein n=1 Tax=Psychrilyobacter piezotolerans TaxID=2293438 RepID=A0ABX9KDE9_9FUSO|nr:MULTISPECIES: cyclic nucleotide-binding domain-containing protein [Psychrilyobacter]MCS5423061.1 cyclic nucleotide-binding domain-containing protein [Psychrilyobacter sp. S5]NDI79271.1 cyclic nucleotide-binding domain-containing protein [Psychrilyobacter piezotolerans]RDE58800.1 cyclic nucleotide-binding domain-containing protein [Psychrilyobacter sp. S5]REI39283.1 cyclic nucleotide-binding domain-containing protein [Psychrilyobacter piezotolerans]